MSLTSTNTEVKGVPRDLFARDGVIVGEFASDSLRSLATKKPVKWMSPGSQVLAVSQPSLEGSVTDDRTNKAGRMKLAFRILWTPISIALEAFGCLIVPEFPADTSSVRYHRPI